MPAAKEVKVPADLVAALKGEKGAAAAWEALGGSCQREYVKWVEEAKKAETRERRIGEVVKRVVKGGD